MRHTQGLVYKFAVLSLPEEPGLDRGFSRLPSTIIEASTSLICMILAFADIQYAIIMLALVALRDRKTLSLLMFVPSPNIQVSSMSGLLPFFLSQN